MAETMRSIATLQSLLADNTVGAISPQDIRDAIIATIQPGHGELSITSTAVTTVSDTTTWLNGAGTYALSGNAMNWDMNTNGQLRYTNAAARVVHIAASVSFTTGGSNEIVELAVGKNGSPITPSIVQRKVGSGSDVGAVALHAFTNVTTNDYLTIMVRNITNTSNITLETANLFGMDMAT